MIAHRVQTKHNIEPPVKFYRTVAVSFLIITVVLLGLVIFVTTKKANIVVVAKDDVKNINLSVNVEGVAKPEQSIIGTVTSTQFAWSEKYFPTGNKSVDMVAEGTVILYNKTGQTQSLIKTTRLLTPSGTLFRLSDRAIIPAMGQVEAKVYADAPGAASEIGPNQFTIPGLPADKQKVIYAESKKPMVGGVRKIGILTDEDIKAAQENFKEKIKQSFVNSLPRSENTKVIPLVANTNITVDKTVGSEVSEFTLSGTSTIVTVSYNAKDLNMIVQRGMAEKVDTISEKIISTSGEPQVSLVAYDASAGTAQIAVTQSLVVTIDANADKLNVNNFLGKDKDEIERYVLGLDHVSGVEVKFSPGWMRSAPSVPDRISVVVKNVK